MSQKRDMGHPWLCGLMRRKKTIASSLTTVALRPSLTKAAFGFELSQVPKQGPIDCAQGRLWGTHGLAD